MAHYTLSMTPIKRSDGRSATAAAAYRAGVEIVDKRTGRVHDYTRKGGVEHVELMAPEGITLDSPEALWNAAEAAEKRKDGRTAREVLIALPCELDADQRLALAREMTADLVARYGVAAQLAVHAPDREGDQRNHHAHILLTTRRYNHDGLGEKSQLEWSDTQLKKAGLPKSADELTAMRERWAAMQNAALECANVASRVDHRSLENQGFDRVPQIHQGNYATQMIRRGTPELSDRASLNLEIIDTNCKVQQLREQLDAKRAVQEWLDIAPPAATATAVDLDLPKPVPSPATDAELSLARASARRDALERIEQHLSGRHQLQIRASLRALERAQQQRRERIEQQEWESHINQPGVCPVTGRIDVESRMMYQLEQSWRESQWLEAAAKATTRQLVSEPPSPLRVFPLPEPKSSRAEPEAMLQELPKAAFDVSDVDVSVALRQIDTTRRELAAAQKRSATVSGRLLDVQLEMRAAAEKGDSTTQTVQEAAQCVATAQSELDSIRGWFKRTQRREAQGRLDAAHARHQSAQMDAQAAHARHATLSREYVQLRELTASTKREVERLERRLQELQQPRMNQIEREQTQERFSSPTPPTPTPEERAAADVRLLLGMRDQGVRAEAIRRAVVSQDVDYADAYVDAMIEHGIGTFGELPPGAQLALDQSSVQEEPDQSGLSRRGNEPMM